MHVRRSRRVAPSSGTVVSATAAAPAFPPPPEAVRSAARFAAADRVRGPPPLGVGCPPRRVTESSSVRGDAGDERWWPWPARGVTTGTVEAGDKGAAEATLGGLVPGGWMPKGRGEEGEEGEEEEEEEEEAEADERELGALAAARGAASSRPGVRAGTAAATAAAAAAALTEPTALPPPPVAAFSGASSGALSGALSGAPHSQQNFAPSCGARAVPHPPQGPTAQEPTACWHKSAAPPPAPPASPAPPAPPTAPPAPPTASVPPLAGQPGEGRDPGGSRRIAPGLPPGLPPSPFS